MHRKLEHRVVVATRAAWLSLPAVFARAWHSAVGVSTLLKMPVVGSRIDSVDLQSTWKKTA